MNNKIALIFFFILITLSQIATAAVDICASDKLSADNAASICPMACKQLEKNKVTSTWNNDWAPRTDTRCADKYPKNLYGSVCRCNACATVLITESGLSMLTNQVSAWLTKCGDSAESTVYVNKHEELELALGSRLCVGHKNQRKCAKDITVTGYTYVECDSNLVVSKCSLVVKE